MRAVLALCLGLAACAGPQQNRYLCHRLDMPEAEIPAERMGADLVWTDGNGIGHRITEFGASQWNCRKDNR